MAPNSSRWRLSSALPLFPVCHHGAALTAVPWGLCSPGHLAKPTTVQAKRGEIYECSSDTAVHKICKLRASINNAKPQRVSLLPLSPLLCGALIRPRQHCGRKPNGVGEVRGQRDLGSNSGSGPYWLSCIPGNPTTSLGSVFSSVDSKGSGQSATNNRIWGVC